MRNIIIFIVAAILLSGCYTMNPYKAAQGPQKCRIKH